MESARHRLVSFVKLFIHVKMVINFSTKVGVTSGDIYRGTIKVNIKSLFLDNFLLVPISIVSVFLFFVLSTSHLNIGNVKCVQYRCSDYFLQLLWTLQNEDDIVVSKQGDF